MDTTQLLKILKNKQDLSLEELLKQLPNLTFIDYINTLLEELNITKSEIIKQTTLDRTYAYQILSGTKVPSQDKVIQIALAMHLDLHQTNILLTLSQNQSLYPKLKRDALIIFAINKHYTVLQTNDLLYEYQYPILT